MERVLFYSDESRDKGSLLFVVAGFAIEGYHTEIWRDLLKIETESGKGKSDWHSTKTPRIRRRYLENVLAIPHLQNRVFYRLFPDKRDGHWEATVHTIHAAVDRFGKNKHCVVSHEGFKQGSRDKLRKAVRKSPAGNDIEIATGHFDRSPMIRLADSLSGLLRVLHGDGARGDYYYDLEQGWFVDLA